MAARCSPLALIIRDKWNTRQYVEPRSGERDLRAERYAGRGDTPDRTSLIIIKVLNRQYSDLSQRPKYARRDPDERKRVTLYAQ